MIITTPDILDRNFRRSSSDSSTYNRLRAIDFLRNSPSPFRVLVVLELGTVPSTDGRIDGLCRAKLNQALIYFCAIKFLLLFLLLLSTHDTLSTTSYNATSFRSSILTHLLPYDPPTSIHPWPFTPIDSLPALLRNPANRMETFRKWATGAFAFQLNV